MQLKWWIYINEYIAEFPNSAICKALKAGMEHRIQYLKHYEDLQTNFDNPTNCEKRLHAIVFDKWGQKIRSDENDVDSRLGTFLRVNPNLKKYESSSNILEIERILISRFRTVSHSLTIEIGRYSG